MSLLMEALRKAEEAKRRGQLEQQPNPAASEAPRNSRQAERAQQAFSLEEREPSVTPEYIRENFVPQSAGVTEATDTPAEEPDAIETPVSAGAGDLQDYLYTEPEAEDLSPPSPRQPIAGQGATRQQQAAASIFTAKRPPPKIRAMKIMAASALVLLLPLGGGLWWYLGNTTSSGILLAPSVANMDLASRGFLDENPPPAATAIDTAATPLDAALTDAQLTDAQLTDAQLTDAPLAAPPVTDAAPEAAPTTAVASNATLDPEEAETAVVASTGTPPLASPEPSPEPATLQPLPPAAPNTIATTAAAATAALDLPAASARPALQISRSTATRQDNPPLVSAYAMLQRGDLLAAGQLYQEVLGETPNNRDALMGLAQVSMRQGDVTAARAGYARLLQLNPRDPLARTGLLQTMQGVNPLEHESELKTLQSEFPDVAPLSYALGNLYAGQQRWSEAQAAYFSAMLAARRAGGAIHPDYAFNLAVSLEQLNQTTAALDYYRQANSLALEITPGFDPALLRSRLAFLEQTQP